MKTRINTILPIALTLLLPGLSLFSGMDDLKNIMPKEIAINWATSSLILYALWQLLWHLWDFKIMPKYQKYLFGILFTAFILMLGYRISQGPTVLVRWHSFFRTLLAFILYGSVQYAFHSQNDIAKLLLEKEQLQTENYKVQLQGLRAQIDPHFLFNSLNTLRSMVHQRHDNSEQFILSLSDFYRQMLKHNENTMLPLAEELKVMESYLFLMKNRNEEAVLFSSSVPTGLEGFHLPTLALQVILENCFKHNSMTSRKKLYIEISHTKDNYIMIRNNIQPKFGQSMASGYGLSMLQKRYELMNIPHHGLLIEQTDSHFFAKLKLIQK